MNRKKAIKMCESNDTFSEIKPFRRAEALIAMPAIEMGLLPETDEIYKRGHIHNNTEENGQMMLAVVELGRN